MRTTTTSLSIGPIGRALQALPAAVAWLLTLVVPAACSIIDEGPDALSGAEAQVVFTLRLDAPTTPATKATWGEEYNKDDGTSYENTIDPATLQVVICPTNGSAYYPLQNLSLTSGDASNSYTFVGSIDVTAEGAPTNGVYKIMVLANCPHVGVYADLDELTYTYTHSDSPTGYLPMWGVTTATLTLAAGERQTLTDPIDLLRAVAKVEVQLSGTAATDYELTGATLTRANTQGYCLPAGWNGVDNTKELERQEASGTTPGSYRPYATTDATNSLTFSSIKNEDGSTKYIVYLPERDNTTAGVTPAEIEVTVQEKNATDAETYKLQFVTYTDGRPVDGTTFNIVRNHLYRYNITAIENGSLTAECSILPWDVDASKWTAAAKYECTLLPEGFDPANPTQESGDPEARLCVLYRPSYDEGNGAYHATLNTGSAGARYEFTLAAPAGTVWTAHLSNTDVFSFSESVDDNKKFVTTGTAREEPYVLQIYINSSKAWTEGTSFDELTDWGRQAEAEHRVPDTYFYITVSADGVHEQELVINPAHAVVPNESDYYKDGRRYAGTDTRIWIRQVPAQQGWSYDELARNVFPDETGNDDWDNFQWWRVNPYWK